MPTISRVKRSDCNANLWAATTMHVFLGAKAWPMFQLPMGILSAISIAQSGKKYHFKYPSVCARS